MKTKSFLCTWAVLALGIVAAPAVDPVKTTDLRVGVYDSRALAFAHFWSAEGSKARNDLIARAQATKAAGDQTQFGKLSQQVRDLQTRDHLEVFSTAPADEAMAALKDKLPALQEELGVARFVSKWDEAVLKEIPKANRLDVTDRLVRELLPTLTEKQQKTIAAMKQGEPLPLEKAKQLAAQGKL